MSVLAQKDDDDDRLTWRTSLLKLGAKNAKEKAKTKARTEKTAAGVSVF